MTRSLMILPAIVLATACGTLEGQTGNGNNERCNSNCSTQEQEDEGPVDADGDGFPADVDCNDEDPDTYPGAQDEPGDGIDQDCDDETNPEDSESDEDDSDDSSSDDETDEDDADDNSDDEDDTDPVDADGDGIPEGEDCDDSDPDPDASERTDYYWDADGDGYGGAFASSACGNEGDATVDNNDDCDDADADVHPGADEVFDDGIDQDCDGLENSGYEAVLTVRHSSSRDISASFYQDGSQPNENGWQEELENASNGDQIVFLTQDGYDAQSSCGVILNGEGINQPYLCWATEVDSGLMVDLWVDDGTSDGLWLDEGDTTSWIAVASTGECAVIMRWNSSPGCTPVDAR